jgi:hypothetical protein
MKISLPVVPPPRDSPPPPAAVRLSEPMRRGLIQAGCSVSRVISAGAKTRMGGPQKPVPRLT